MRSRVFPTDRVTVLGVLNVTPDSFSADGVHADLDRVAERASAMERDGAHAIDVGGESTRPGAATVEVGEELARVIPAIEAIAKATRLPISVDTRKAAVARAALEAGACAINDVSGGRHDPAILCVAAESGVELVLGHLRGEPATMQAAPRFHDVVLEVGDELAAAVERAVAAGVGRDRIVVDPGIGFGKELDHNLALLAQVDSLRARVGCPVLVGPSRKSFLGRLTGDPVAERDAATVAACAIAVFAGADAIRVHDVPMGVRAALVGAALRKARGAEARP